MSARDLLRFVPGTPVTEAGCDAHPGVSDKRAAAADVEALVEPSRDLQERLFAEGKHGSPRRVVVVLQGMDTSGKGGASESIGRLVAPAGLRVTSFGKPTDEERAHDFLWRIERALPAPGNVAVFDRSHYEDVLVVRVHDLVPRDEWESRYDRINAWEAELAAQGTTLLKVFLHLSYDEQRERLLARLDDPAKHWKVNPADLTERGHWAEYREAYQAALERCSTDVAPWYVVPADRKWYRDWAVAHLLHETLSELDPQWPARPDLDLAGMRDALREG
ncbi:MAG: polyphosphate kinase 2 family protein [Mycobacteriales bacterium]|nr:polyphosphate kinase 2 family protein [Mycobacteriales bacterium]